MFQLNALGSTILASGNQPHVETGPIPGCERCPWASAHYAAILLRTHLRLRAFRAASRCEVGEEHVAMSMPARRRRALRAPRGTNEVSWGHMSFSAPRGTPRRAGIIGRSIWVPVPQRGSTPRAVCAPNELLGLAAPRGGATPSSSRSPSTAALRCAPPRALAPPLFTMRQPRHLPHQALADQRHGQRQADACRRQRRVQQAEMISFMPPRPRWVLARAHGCRARRSAGLSGAPNNPPAHHWATTANGGDGAPSDRPNVRAPNQRAHTDCSHRHHARASIPLSAATPAARRSPQHSVAQHGTQL